MVKVERTIENGKSAKWWEMQRWVGVRHLGGYPVVRRHEIRDWAGCGEERREDRTMAAVLMRDLDGRAICGMMRSPARSLTGLMRVKRKERGVAEVFGPGVQIWSE